MKLEKSPWNNWDFRIEVPLFVPKKKNSGADVIELGVPFSDPMADGSAIEAASVVAIKNGALSATAPAWDPA